MDKGFDSEAALRQAFGPGFDVTPSDGRRAREILEGRLTLGPHPTTDLPTDPTWLEDPFGQGNWTFQFHSLRWLDVLRRRAAAGDASGMATWEHYVRSWLAANPPGASPSPWAWVDMADGLRAQVLVYALPYVNEPSWVIDAIRTHAEWLAEPAHLKHGNHALHQLTGLFVAGRALRSEEWTRYAVDQMGALFDTAYDDEGVNEEGSTHYQYLNFKWWIACLERLRLEGLEPWPTAGRLELVPEFLAHATRPDGNLERLGDTDDEVADGLSSAVVEYALSGGESGSPPDNRRRVYKRGWAFARSTWGAPGGSDARAATYYSIRYGRQDTIHGHADGGSITYWADGVPWVTDTGKYAYDKSPMRQYVTSRAGHNVVDIVGSKRDWAVQVQMVDHLEADRHDAYLLEDRGYAGVLMKRLIAYSRDGQWLLVQDRIRADREVEVVSRLHLGKDVDVVEHGRCIGLKQCDARASLIFAGSRPEVEFRRGQEEPFGGWVSTGWRSRVPATEVLLRRRGRSVRMTFVITPAAVPRGTALRAADGGRAGSLAIEVPGRNGIERVTIPARGIDLVVEPLTGAPEGGR